MAQDPTFQIDAPARERGAFVILRQVRPEGRGIISEKLTETFSLDSEECSDIFSHLPAIIAKCPDLAAAKQLKRQLDSEGIEMDISNTLAEECHRILWPEAFAEKIVIEFVPHAKQAAPDAEDSESRGQYFLMQYRRSESMRQKLLSYFQQTAREFEEMQKDYEVTQRSLESEREKNREEKIRESRQQADLIKQIHLLEKEISKISKDRITTEKSNIENETRSADKIRQLESALREQERKAREAQSALNTQSRTREQEKCRAAEADDVKIKLEAALQRKDFEIEDVRDIAARLEKRLQALERENAAQKLALDETAGEWDKERQQLAALRADYESRMQQRNQKIVLQEKTISEQARAVAAAMHEKKELQIATQHLTAELERRLSTSEKERKVSAEASAAANAKSLRLEALVEKQEKRILGKESEWDAAQREREENEKITAAFKELKKQALLQKEAADKKITELEGELAKKDPATEAKIEDLTQLNKELNAATREKEERLISKEALLIQAQEKSAKLNEETRRLVGLIQQHEVRAAELQEEMKNRAKGLARAEEELERERRKNDRAETEAQAQLNERDKKIFDYEKMIQEQAQALEQGGAVQADLRRQIDELFEADAQAQTLHQSAVNALKEDMRSLEENLAKEKQSQARALKAKDEEINTLRKDFSKRADTSKLAMKELEAQIAEHKEQAALFKKQSEETLAEGIREREKIQAGTASEAAKRNSQISKLKTELEASAGNLKNEKKKNAALSGLQQRLETDLGAAKAELSERDQQLTQRTKELSDQAENYSHIAALTEELERQIASLQSRLISEEGVQKQREQESETKDKEIAAFRQDVKTREEAIEDARRQVAEAAEQLRKLELQQRKALAELQAENERRQEIEKMLRERIGQIDNLKDKLNSATREHEEQQSNIQRESWKKDGQIEELQRNLKDHMAEKTLLQQQLQVAAETLNDERANLATLLEASQHLQQELKNRKKELESAQHKQLELEETVRAHKEFSTGLEILIEKTEHELAGLQEAHLRVDEAGRRMAEELKEKEGELRKTKAAVVAVRRDWEEHINELEQRLIAHQKTVTQQAGEIERLKNQLETEQRGAAREREELEKAAVAELFEKNKRIAALENDLQKLCNKIAEVEGGMESLATEAIRQKDMALVALGKYEESQKRAASSLSVG